MHFFSWLRDLTPRVGHVPTERTLGRSPRRKRAALRLHLEPLEDRWCPSSPRPIADFLMAQGTTSVFPNGINAGGPAGLPDELGSTTSTATFLNGTARFARVDYTGQDAAFLGLNLGTTTSGTISERALADGTAEDTVNLITHNAFAWANHFDGLTNPVVFGFLPSQLAADPTLHPPLADSMLQVVVRIPAPGAPLPDLVNDFVLGNAPPGYALVSDAFHATATGTTPTGQEATLVVSETGVLGRTPNVIGDFGFTAEVIEIQIHGNPPGNAPAAVAGSAPGPAASVAPAPLSAAHASHLRAIDAAFATSLDDPLAWDIA